MTSTRRPCRARRFAASSSRRVAAPRNEDRVVTARAQLAREFGADTRRGAGDERGAALARRGDRHQARYFAAPVSSTRSAAPLISRAHIASPRSVWTMVTDTATPSRNGHNEQRR